MTPPPAAPPPDGDGDLYVIVPAVMGVGLLLSLLTLARDELGRVRGHATRSRHVAAWGHTAAVGVLAGTEAARRDHAGLRGRGRTAALAVLLLALAAYLTPGATWNFFNPVNRMRDLGWLWALSMSVVVLATALGVALAAAALRWSDLPAQSRPVLLATSLTASGAPAPPQSGRDVVRLPLRVRLTADGASRVRLAATLWLAAVVGTLGWLLWTRGIPRSPEAGIMGRALEVPLQVVLLGLLVVGRLIALRWHRTGAVVIAAAAALLGYAASVLHPPYVTAAISTAAFVPAALLWLSWQRTADRRTIGRLALVTTVVLAGVVLAADRSYTSTFGPTHPASAAPGPSRDLVDWMWAGGVTSDSVTVRARTRASAQRVRLLLQPVDGPSRVPVAVPATPVGEDPRIVAATATGLAPDTHYTWTIEVDGRTDPGRRAGLRTFPRGPASFSFAVGSCTVTGSNGAVFDAIRRTDPLFLALSGDLLYANIETDDADRFRRAYTATLRSPAQSALYAATPIAYVWDDHDYSGNDGDRTAVSRPAAQSAYREVVPHYPLGLEPDGPIFQAFTVGRVRVLLTDNRSARTPAVEPDGPGKTMLGEAQRAALLRELRAAGQWAAVIWVNPSPWVEPARAGSDGWGGYATERRLIADTIAQTAAHNLVMLSGDAHMLALDDGSNTDFSTAGGGGFPLLHAAALDRPGSVKGGPYSGGVQPGGGQFGTVSVRDDGQQVGVTLTGHDWRGEQVMSMDVDLPLR